MGARIRTARQGLRTQLGALSHNGRLLITFALVNGVALMGVGSLINPYLRNMGLSAAFIGTYFAVSSIAQAVASFSGGFLADAVGRRRVWLFGKALQAASYIVLASGVGTPWIMAAPVLAGLSQIGAGAYLAVTAEAAGDGQRATFFSVLRTFDAVVGTVAPLVGGLVADTWGARTAFLLVMPLFAIVAMIINRLQESPAAPVPVPRDEVRSGVVSRLQRLASRLRDGVLRGPYPRTATAIMGYQLVNGFSNGIINLALPLMLKDRFGLGYAGIGAAQTAISLGTAVMLIAGGRMADKRGRRVVILASTLSFSLIFILLLFVNAVWQFYALLFVGCLLGNAAGGAFGATAMECVRGEVRATFGGVCQALHAAGLAAGSIIGGILYVVQPNHPITAAIFSNLIGLVVLWALLDETGRKSQTARAAAVAAPGAPREAAE
jgi:MFS family permease